MWSCCSELIALFLLWLFHFCSSAQWIPGLAIPDKVRAKNAFELTDAKPSATVTSPNYPANYPDNSREAYWLFGNGKPMRVRYSIMGVISICLSVSRLGSAHRTTVVALVESSGQCSQPARTEPSDVPLLSGFTGVLLKYE